MAVEVLMERMLPGLVFLRKEDEMKEKREPTVKDGKPQEDVRENPFLPCPWVQNLQESAHHYEAAKCLHSECLAQFVVKSKHENVPSVRTNLGK